MARAPTARSRSTPATTAALEPIAMRREGPGRPGESCDRRCPGTGRAPGARAASAPNGPDRSPPRAACQARHPTPPSHGWANRRWNSEAGPGLGPRFTALGLRPRRELVQGPSFPAPAWGATEFLARVSSLAQSSEIEHPVERHRAVERAPLPAPRTDHSCGTSRPRRRSSSGSRPVPLWHIGCTAFGFLLWWPCVLDVDGSGEFSGG